MSERVAIVGNGPVGEGAAAQIDACDCVIRFNRPTHSSVEAGERTDILFFMNSGKNAQALLSDPSYLSHPAVSSCRRVILPYDPSIIARYHPKPNILSRLRGRRADWTERAVEVFGAAGKEVSILPPEFYETCCENLDISQEEKRRVFPSTGIIAMIFAIGKGDPNSRGITLYGFTWQGWKRHEWQREQHWVREQVDAGVLELYTE